MLLNKTFLVTGASSGIGGKITAMLLKEGARVVGVSRQLDRLPKHDKFTGISLDFNQPGDLEAKIKAMLAESLAFDGCVFSAGIGRFGGLEQFSFAQMQELMNVNFLGQALLAKHVLPGLKKRGHGDLIFIGSEAALEGTKNGSLYCASKFALRGFSQALREECAKSNVRISLINPGMVRTEFFNTLDFSPGEAPENYIESDDIAATVKYILTLRAGTSVDEINLSPLKKVINFQTKKPEM